MQRLPWDAFFLDFAARAARQSTCPRASVGCILTIDKSVIATGFNGVVSGDAHCADVGCVMHHGHCITAVHAEINAICNAAKRGVRTDGATAYVTHAPCIHCAKALLSAGVGRIVYALPYDDGVNMQYLAAHGERVQIERIEVQG